jgi:lysozyme family protein
MTAGSDNGQATPTTLDRLEQVAKIFATVAIPIVVAIGGWIIQTTVEHDKERAAQIQQEQQSAIDKDKISLEYVKIAKDILTSTDNVPPELTTWSWRLLDGVSPVKFAREDLDRLIKRQERIPAPAASPGALTFPSLASEYTQLFGDMKLGPQAGDLNAIADKIVAAKPRYESVERATGVPWYFVAVLHYAENGMNFETHLHNDDPLTARTVHVPKGRPLTWEDSARDALELGGLTRVQDWSSARLLYETERWNGFGFRRRQINSPFVWNCTSQYTKGRYVEDGHFDPNAAPPPRCGAAALLRQLMDRRLVALN